MRIPQDERFRLERARHALRFCCESCAMWDPAEELCAHRYPTADHRLARYEDPTVEIVFCKDYDAA